MYRVVISCAIHLRIKEDAWIQGKCRQESQTRCGEKEKVVWAKHTRIFFTT